MIKVDLLLFFLFLLSIFGLIDNANATVKFDIKGHQNSDKHPNPKYLLDERYANVLKKRGSANALQVKVNNVYTYYSIAVEIGTPSQQQNLLIDTGSSDIWVIGSDNPYCAKTDKEKSQAAMGVDYINCDEIGLFDEKKSKTFHDNKTDFSIQYGDNSFAKGNWGTDVISFGDTKIKDMSIAVGEKANSSQGVFGIGLKGLETTVQNNEGSAYDNFPMKLKNEGKIDSISYSLWLNDIKSHSGNILFGGVDHSKYSGQLQKVPIINNSKDSDEPIEMTIALSKLGIKKGGEGKQKRKDDDNMIFNDKNLPVLLDSGTSLMLLPENILDAIGTHIGAEYSKEVGYYIHECSIGDKGGSLEFDFSGIKIDVAISDILLPLTDGHGNPSQFENGENACALGISQATDTIILGDTFLRSIYAVYDLENLEIAMAPVKYNQTDNGDIESIKKNGGIPNAKKAPNYKKDIDFVNSVSVNTKSKDDGFNGLSQTLTEKNVGIAAKESTSALLAEESSATDAATLFTAVTTSESVTTSKSSSSSASTGGGGDNASGSTSQATKTASSGSESSSSTSSSSSGTSSNSQSFKSTWSIGVISGWILLMTSIICI